MDPLSIAAFAITGSKILMSSAKLLDTFIRATGDNDRRIRALQALSNGVARFLKDLEKALNAPILNVEENAELWGGVYDEVKSCRRTIDEIDQKMEPLRGSGEGNFAIEVWRIFRRQLLEPEINRLLSYMQIHSTNLQLALQTVTIIITASTPGAIKADLAPQIERLRRLERMVETLTVYLNPAADVDRQRISTKHRALKVDENTTTLYFSARSLVDGSMGSEIRSCASDAHFEPISTRKEQPVFEEFEAVLNECEVTTNSEVGVYFSENKRNDVNHWIEDAPDHQPAEAKTNHCTAESENDSEADLANNLKFKKAEKAFARGMRSYEQDRFSEAREFLKLGIDLSKSLRVEQKNKLELQSRQFHHALSCIVESSLLPEAESSFRLVLERTGSQKTDAHLRCFALYQLARVQLRIGKHASARKYCERAVVRMEEEPLIGDSHEAYANAMHLLALILWAEGDKTQAWVCSDLLPSERQIVNEDAFDTELAFVIDSNGTRSALGNDKPADAAADLLSPSSQPSQVTGTEDETATTAMATQDEEVLESTPAQSMPISLPEQPAAHRPTSQFSGVIVLTPDLTSPTSMASAEAPIHLPMDDYSGAQRTIDGKKFHGKAGVIKGLCWAAEHCRLDVLELLIASPDTHLDAHKSSIFSAHDTPLMIAALNGHLPVCKRLMEANASVDLVSRGRTALSCAVYANKPSICKLLLDHGATPDWVEGQDSSPLSIAAKHGNYVRLCQLLLDYKADVDEIHMHTKTQKQTALMRAAGANETKVMRWLLDHKARPDGPKNSVISTTPLIEAVRGYALAACRLLLERKADPKLRTSRGKTAGRSTTDEGLRDFIEKWPASRSWQKLDPGLILQP